MTDPARKSRRNLLKTVAAGGGVITAARMLPEKWTSPVVDSVLLPAHAQITGSLSCGSRTEPQSEDSDAGDIAILFDGDSCGLIEFNEAEDGVPSSAVAAFDTDQSENLFWDDLGTGIDWTRVNTNIPGPDDNSNGDYFVDVFGGGVTYRVSFNVNVGAGFMTVSNVQIVPL